MRATPRIPRCAIPIHTDQSWLDPLHDRKNGCGKRGNQRFGMIAAAAGNGKGVPQVGALKCLTALLARFANDPDVCSDQQIQLALDGARLHRREYAIQLLMSVRVGQVIQSTVPPELDLRIQESVDRENLARENQRMRAEKQKLELEKEALLVECRQLREAMARNLSLT